MASLYKAHLLLFLLLLLLLLLTEANWSREIDGENGGLVGCWEAMLELRYCTNEIVLFFINGESYLTLECCRAIRLITSSCWPTMLSAMGFTSQEADILRNYCDPKASPPATTILPSDGMN